MKFFEHLFPDQDHCEGAGPGLGDAPGVEEFQQPEWLSPPAATNAG